MMIRLRIFRTYGGLPGRLSLLAATIVLSACSNSLEDHPPVYPAKGKVLVNGKPMNGGTIIFEFVGGNDGAPKNAWGGPFRVTGKISNEGTYNLIAFIGSEGVPAGDYKVGVLALQGRSEGNMFDRKTIVTSKNRPAVSTKTYADPKTSGLRARITKDGPNESVIELKSGGDAPVGSRD